jgi:hypothetical protein
MAVSSFVEYDFNPMRLLFSEFFMVLPSSSLRIYMFFLFFGSKTSKKHISFHDDDGDITRWAR